jgi:hypothetical protein
MKERRSRFTDCLRDQMTMREMRPTRLTGRTAGRVRLEKENS